MCIQKQVKRIIKRENLKYKLIIYYNTEKSNIEETTCTIFGTKHTVKSQINKTWNINLKDKLVSGIICQYSNWAYLHVNEYFGLSLKTFYKQISINKLLLYMIKNEESR